MSKRLLVLTFAAFAATLAACGPQVVLAPPLRVEAVPVVVQVEVALPRLPPLPARAAIAALEALRTVSVIDALDAACSETASPVLCRMASAMYTWQDSPWHSPELALVLLHEACLAGDAAACDECDRALRREIDALEADTLRRAGAHHSAFCGHVPSRLLMCRRAELICERRGFSPEQCRRRQRPDPLHELNLSAQLD